MSAQTEQRRLAAIMFTDMVGYSGFAPRSEALALELLEDHRQLLADGHVAMGTVRVVFDWDWAGGEKDFKRALELSRHSSLALDAYANLLVPCGRFDEAIAMLKWALEFDPLSTGLNSDLGWTHYFAGRPEQAIPHFRKALELDPRFFQAHLYISECYLLTGNPAEALSELEIAQQLAPDSFFSQMALGYAYGVTGRTAEARNVLAALDRLAQKRYVAPSARALVHAGLGETNAALDWLEKAYLEHDAEIAWLKVDPRLAALRNEKRFQALMKKAGLGQ